MWTLRCFNTCVHRFSLSWVERHGDNPAVTWVKSDKLWLPAMQCRPEASLPSIWRNWYDCRLDDTKDVIDFHLNTFTWIDANLISKCDHGLDECPWACYAYAYFSLWSPYVIGQTIYIFILFLLLSFFSSPKYQRSEIGCLLYFGTWCGLSANLECRSEMRYTRLAANTGRKKSPFRHHRTTLSGHIFATKACIDNWKKTC